MSDLIKNKSNQELLNQWVFDTKEWNEKRLETSTENKINEQVEKSFQQFFNENKNTLEKLTDQEKQKWFNDRLDWEVTRILDREKINEIKWVNWDIEKSLKSLIFEVELNELEWQIQSQREEESTQTILNSGISIEWIIASQVTSEMLDTLVSTINTTNFAEKQYVVECLNRWKREDIRRIQYLLIWKKDNYIAWKSWNKESCLSRYGTDWLLWNETYNALIDYIDSHKSDTETGEQTATVWAWITSWSRTETWRWSSSTASSWSRTEIWGWSSSGTRVPSSAERDNSASWQTASESQSSSYRWETAWAIESSDNSWNETTEYLDKSHNIKKLYTWNWGETITIATNLPDYEIVPTVLKNQFRFEKDNNWNITYILPNENWEWTVSIKVGDKIHTITIKSTESKEWPAETNALLAAIDKLDLERTTEENNDIIPKKLKELKEEYNKIKKWEKTVEDAEKELRSIEESAKKLLRAKERNKLELYLDQASKWQINWKDSLNAMIIDGAVIYIGGKYLTKEKFLQWVRTKKAEFIKKAKYKYLDISMPDDFWDTESTNCKITKVIITDDESILEQNNIWKEEIQYDAYWYVDMEKTWENFNWWEKRAIRKLVQGIDKSLSIVDVDYRKATLEKTNLNKLRSGLIALVNSGQDIREVFNFIADNCRDNFRGSKKDRKNLIKSKFDIKNDIQAWNMAKLWELYVAYKSNQDSKAMWDYFMKVMWLLDNYFMRWVKVSPASDEKISSFEDMYKKERIGVAKVDLIDSDKQNKAINQLFKEWKDSKDLLWVPFENTKQLRDLKPIIKHIDLVSFFARPWIAQESATTPEFKNNSEKKFYSEYRRYAECLRNNELDDNWKPKISESEYYNAVFDFLVWVWEARWDIVSAVNSLKLYDWNIDPDTLAQSGFETAEEMRLVWMLSDINSDWRVDFADKWYKMWLEIKNTYKDAMVDYQYWVISKSPMQNLIEFAKTYSTKLWHVSTSNTLQTITNYDHPSLLDQFEKNPSILKYLQNLLVNSPANLVDSIFKYGNGSEAAAETETQSEQAEMTASQEAIEMIMNDAKFNEAFEREYKNLVEQWVKDTPEVKARFKPIVAAWLLANIAQTNYYDENGNFTGSDKSTSWNPKLAVGGVLQTEKAWDFSLMLGVWTSIEWEDIDLSSLWLCMGRGDSRRVWKNGNTIISSWVWTWFWVDLSKKNGSLFIPLVSAWLEVSTLVNKNQLKWLDMHASTYFNVWWSIWRELKKPVPYGEVHMGISRDKIEWIEKTYNNIKEQLWWENWIIAELLNNVDFSKDETEWGNAIQWALINKFYPGKKNLSKKDMEAVRWAADNIYRWLVYYMIWTNLRDITDEKQKKVVIKWIADNIADYYAVSRKNDSLQKLDGKVNLDKFAIWAIFLASIPYPIPMIWFSFSRYRWLYSTETQSSQKEYQRQLHTEWNAKQQWMEDDLWFYDEENEIMTQKWIDYINAKLQISNWRVEVPKIEFVESTSVGWKNVSIKLPKDLYKYVNINVDPKLTNYASNDEEWNVIVPANTILTLLTSSKTDSGKFNLIIWDKKVDSDDIVIGADNWLKWDAASYEWDKWEYILDINAFNTELETEFGEKADFPIQKCESTMNISWENFALLRLKEWKTIQDMWWVDSKTKVDDWIIYTPQTGTLTIYQTVNWEYQLYYQSSPSDNMNINYEIEWKETVTYTEHSTERTESITFDTTESLYWKSFKYELDRILNSLNNKDIHNLLLEYDTNDWRLYTEFMDATCNTKDDGKVYISDYDDALDKLKNMLDNSSGFKNNYQWLDKLKNLVNNNAFTKNQKIMLVDQCKMFFSYEEKLTDWSKDCENLKNLIEDRWDVYETLPGYVTTWEFPLKWKDYRSKVVNQLEWRADLSSNVVWNLVGMTAFYKRWKWTNVQMTEWRGYSMTEMWNTTPLWWVMVPIESSELAATKEWFWKNFDASEIHKDILTKTILDHVKNLIFKTVYDIDANNITINDIENILKWQNSIDIWWKNVKIDLDIDYVFYLLQECGNESIWIQLNWIKIETWWIEIEEHVNPANPDQSQVTTKNTKRKWWFWIYTKTHVASNEQAFAHKWAFGIWLFGGVQQQTSPSTEGGVNYKPHWNRPSWWNSQWWVGQHPHNRP